MLNKNTIARIYVIARGWLSALTKGIHRSNLSYGQTLARLPRRNFVSPRNDAKFRFPSPVSRLTSHLSRLTVSPRKDVKKSTIRPFNRSTFQPAFTLAEVLITLGIIGVVAMMTIPVLLQNVAKAETVAKLKEKYNVLAQALKMSEIDNGNNQFWDLGSGGTFTPRQSFDTYWAPYLKTLKYCDTLAACGYASGTSISDLSGGTYLSVINSTETTVLLPDGTVIIVISTPSWVVVDLNAGKGPNTLGKDVFIFIVDANRGLMPRGYGTGATIDGECKSTGSYCAAKIMQDGWQIKSDYPWS